MASVACLACGVLDRCLVACLTFDVVERCSVACLAFGVAGHCFVAFYPLEFDDAPAFEAYFACSAFEVAVEHSGVAFPLEHHTCMGEPVGPVD